MNREELRRLAQDTLAIMDIGKMTLNGKTLDLRKQLAETRTNSKYYIRDKYGDIRTDKLEKFSRHKASDCKIYVWNTDTLEAASDMKRICKDDSGSADSTSVLNFASARNPGGGFTYGAMAQEESLCSRSTLYDSLRYLDKNTPLYNYSRSHLNNMLYCDWVAFSKGVLVIRNRNMNLCKPWTVNVLTSPAPNRREYNKRTRDDSRVEDILKRRCEYILDAAIANEQYNLVLGAFGCGVFGNDPITVASVWRELLDTGYVEYFDNVAFAIKAKSEYDTNLAAFKRVFDTRKG